jgi:purine-nucleoside phosphorylase
MSMSGIAKAKKTKPSQDFLRTERAAKFILARTKLRPRIGLVLGSGLGAFANELAGATRIDYEKIPHFPRSTAIGHAGRMVVGKVGSVPVATMQGRVHLFEGYTGREVIFPMRVMARMGIRAVLITNAAGGINHEFKRGCLVVLRDHINLQGTNPLIGPNEERFGVRFPDLTQVYWTPYQDAALQEGKRL